MDKSRHPIMKSITGLILQTGDTTRAVREEGVRIRRLCGNEVAIRAQDRWNGIVDQLSAVMVLLSSLREQASGVVDIELEANRLRKQDLPQKNERDT